jgi:hypothetical protein
VFCELKWSYKLEEKINPFYSFENGGAEISSVFLQQIVHHVTHFAFGAQTIYFGLYIRVCF